METSPQSPAPVRNVPLLIERWPTEIPFLALILFVSIPVWIFLSVSIIGIFYVALFGIVFFVARLSLTAHIRGSGIRLGPNQFPELYHRVVELSQKLGLRKTPEAYIVQAGGLLNAFAARFLRSNMIILYSDLLEACGDNLAARDMIIAHELGHIRAGHLRWHWFLAPGMMIPFLGTAYSRAREYTCDRYGLIGAGNREGAMRGLAILAAGGQKGPKVNLEEFGKQKELLNTGFMTIGEWLSTHPPLSKRILALDQELNALVPSQTKGTIRALTLMASLYLIPMAIIFSLIFAFASVNLKKIRQQVENRTNQINQVNQQQTDAQQRLEDILKKLNENKVPNENPPGENPPGENP